MFTDKEIEEINNIPITDKFIESPEGQKAALDGVRDAYKETSYNPWFL